ncbi:hypothetical protein H257_15207 [Aphanomyces astaci]|uniref:Uncharacterized protein n=1 Tax=Aphanomyces astaci TaxID=112090 RepID=W4FNP5_APHAT|nr:hypothetical protein H257_15207 [Aphanomyces astaci]ETV69070.1 hypothetical protein H257_15207 [Aphanomyces astaci]|eukprot:XP_009841529.1 hypothetical protein H257_15207 [Aphanomyces astaci]
MLRVTCLLGDAWRLVTVDVPGTDTVLELTKRVHTDLGCACPVDYLKLCVAKQPEQVGWLTRKELKKLSSKEINSMMSVVMAPSDLINAATFAFPVAPEEGRVHVIVIIPRHIMDSLKYERWARNCGCVNICVLVASFLLVLGVACIHKRLSCEGDCLCPTSNDMGICVLVGFASVFPFVAALGQAFKCFCESKVKEHQNRFQYSVFAE